MTKIQIIKGSFNKKEAIELITQMIHVKVRFQEEKINKTTNEEDIKMREQRIKQLQKDLYNARNIIEKQKSKISIDGEISIID